MIIKRSFIIAYAVLLLSYNVTATYCKGAIALPIEWSAAEVIATILSLVGININLDKKDDGDTFIAHSEEYAEIVDQFEAFVKQKYDVVSDKADKIITDFKQVIEDAQISGKITHFTLDMYIALRSFANYSIDKIEDIFDAPVTVGQKSYQELCALNGIEFSQYEAKHYEKFIYPYKNIYSIVSYDKYNYSGYTCVKTVTIGFLNNTKYYILDAGKVLTYDYKKGEYILYANKIESMSSMITIRYLDDGTERYDRIIDNGTVYNYINYTLTSLSNTEHVFRSYQDMVANNPYEDAVDTPAIIKTPGIDKVREKYGNLDNISIVDNDGKAIDKDGSISVDVVDKSVWEMVMEGTLALDDVIPGILIDTTTDAVIDDSYVDDTVPDKPYEEVETGPMDLYVPTAGITTLFPFCIPFDLIRTFKALKASAKAPYWEVPIKSEHFNINYTFVIDFTQFEPLAVIFRLFMTVLYIIGLILVTRGIIKG